MESNPFEPFDLKKDQSKTSNHPSETDSIDPFGIAAFALKEAENKDGAHELSRTSRSNLSVATIPPKLVVKLAVFEDVSSQAKPGHEAEGTSVATIEGTVYAQVQCSDALKNAPFVLKASVPLRLNPKFMKKHSIFVPKQEIGFVPVAFYSKTTEIEHMPILVERKVTVAQTSCRIAIQVRSKLTNLGNMEEFSVVVAIPERVDGSTIEVVRGDGEWNELKRTIKWKLPLLNKGESFMVSASCDLWKEVEDDIRFPVLLRCGSSADQISDITCDAYEDELHPSSLNANLSKSFRLLHRLT